MSYRYKFDNFFSAQRPIYSLSNKVWNPPTDIFETADATVIKMEVAGLDEEAIQVLAQHNHLIVRGRRVPFTEPRKVAYHLMEIHYDQFERIFEFSQTIAENTVQVTYKQGFLVIEVRKCPAQTTQVTVQIIEDLPRG